MVVMPQAGPSADASVYALRYTGATRASRPQVVNIECRFLWWSGEPAFDALLQSRQQDAVAEALPALLGVVDRHDNPAISRGASRVERLALGQAVSVGMHRRKGRLVLLLRTAGEVMHDSVRHSRSPDFHEFFNGSANRFIS